MGCISVSISGVFSGLTKEKYVNERSFIGILALLICIAVFTRRCKKNGTLKQV